MCMWAMPITATTYTTAGIRAWELPSAYRCNCAVSAFCNEVRSALVLW
jgi:hypothetical protein